MDNVWNGSGAGLQTAFSPSRVEFEFQASPEAMMMRSDFSPVTSDDWQPWRGPATLFPEEHGIDLVFAPSGYELRSQATMSPPPLHMKDDGKITLITTMPFYRMEERTKFSS